MTDLLLHRLPIVVIGLPGTAFLLLALAWVVGAPPGSVPLPGSPRSRWASPR
ncbi:MAG: hypothetical protein R3B72_49900 [Polyangiaceae bacterium]